MSTPAVRVENLSKMYRIGAQEQPPQTTAGTLKRAAMSPIDYLRRTLRPPREEEIFWALRDISFEVRPGEVIGIIGRNGAGKSTLLKILSRITEPTSGRAVIKGRVGSLLEVGTGFHPELTGRENIYLNGTMLGMKGHEIKKQFDAIVDFSGVEKFLDTPVKRYSSGMYVRLAFAVAAHLEPEILIVDEVLSVGDAEFQKKCLGKMEDVATQGRTILFVSHNMAAVQQLCQRGMVLTDGRVHLLGPIEEAVHRYIQDVQTPLLRTDLAKRTDRTGTQWLKFIKVAVCDAEGNELKQVMSGQDVRIKLYYLSEREKPGASVLVSFNVRSSQGYLLANLNSADTGHTMLTIHSSGYFECYWPKFQLRSGRYDCNLFCSVNGEIVDWLQNAFIITVEDGDYYGTGKLIERTQGDVLIEHQWTAGSSAFLSEHGCLKNLSMQEKT